MIPLVLAAQGQAGSVLAQSSTPAPDARWWEPVTGSYTVAGAWQAKGAGSYAESLLDLSGNGRDLEELGAPPAWSTSLGWHNFHVANSLDSGVLGNELINGTIIAFCHTTAGNNASVFGHRISFFSENIQAFHQNTGSMQFRHGGNYTQSVAINSDMTIAVSPTGAYVNGANVGTQTSGTPTLAHNRGIYVGGSGQDGNNSSKYNGRIYAIVMYSSLSDEAAQIADVSSKMVSL